MCRRFRKRPSLLTPPPPPKPPAAEEHEVEVRL
jgi:hypothetical protein